jgi:hypothetical protein
MPMPAFAPMERLFCSGKGSEVELGVDAVVLELTTEAEVVEVAEVDDVLGGSRVVLVAVQPSNGTEKMVCKSAGDEAINRSFVGLSQDGSPDEFTPQHCQSPDVLFHVASACSWDVHLYG